MSDNIQVSIRVRPLNTRESLDSQVCRCIQVDKRSNSILITVNSIIKQFTFDYVADEESTQQTIFDEIARPITENCLKGYNGTVFSYGQTGSGKTFTIIGHSNSTFNDRLTGILPRCLDLILSKTSNEMKLNSNVDYLIKCSFLEIYNEQIRDLLNDDSRNLQIREDIKKGCYVEDLIEETVFNLESGIECLAKGLQRRHIGSTLMNNKSSRSHSVFTVHIEAKEKKADVLTYRNSLFNIIDLAGSERQKPAGTSGERLREAAMINKSLSTLGDVINSLVDIAEGKNRYVRYRDSRLTFLLKDSIGGNSKTCIIANISPAFISYSETLSTLRFAERAKYVKNRAVINEDTIGTINELKAEVMRLKSLLSNSPESLPLNPRLRDLQEMLAKNTQIRLMTESALQQEIDNKENFIKELCNTIKKFEDKVNGEKLVNRLKDENIRRLQKGEKQTETQIINELKQEIQILRRENLNHPVAAKYFVENDALKHQINYLENELRESPGSLCFRLKQNQEYTESLNQKVLDTLQDHKILEMQMEKVMNRNIELERNLVSAEEHKNQLVLELETLKIKIETLEEQLCGFNDPKKTPMKELDLNIKNPRGSIKSPFNICQNFVALSPYQGLARKSMERNFVCDDCRVREEKVMEMEKKLNLFAAVEQELKFFEEESFRLGEEVKKLNNELNKKDAVISDIWEDYHLLEAENEMYSAQIADFTHQINEKSSIITELTCDKQFSMLELQDFTKLKEQNSMLNREIVKLQLDHSKLAQEILLSVQSRELMIENLKKLQNNEYNLQKEIDELSIRLREAITENKSLKKQLEQSTKEVVKLTGHNNLNQKISYLSKLKEEFNTLKDINFRIKEENKKKTDKIEELSKKYEKLVKANGIKDFLDEWEGDKRRVEEVELENEVFQEIFSSIHTCLAEVPFFGETCHERIDVAVKNIMRHYEEEICNMEEEVKLLNRELSRKDSIVKMLEGEMLLMKQKNEIYVNSNDLIKSNQY